MITLTSAQTAAADGIDAIDLEPIVFKLTTPEPGHSGLSLAEADQAVALYRCFMKLCAWYPDQPIVPCTAIDQVWHTHILDTGKYAADSQQAVGYFLHHFPYLGLRGPADIAEWDAAYQVTCELFFQHFAITLPAGQAGRTCHNGGSSCNGGGMLCSNEECERKSTAGLDQVRPRPDRPPVPA
jgi:hypothetical protein